MSFDWLGTLGNLFSLGMTGTAQLLIGGKEAPNPPEKGDSDYVEKWRDIHAVFSNGNMVMDAMTLLTFYKLYKTDPKLLSSLAEKYLDSVTNIIVALEESSKTNWLNALINQQLTANILNRIGLLSEAARVDVLTWYANVFNTMAALEAVADTIGALTSLGGSYFGGMAGKGGI